jgi:hypothetical protein
MSRGEGDNEALRALVEGAPIGSSGSGAGIEVEAEQLESAR